MSLELSHTHLSMAAFALQWQNSCNRHCLAHKAKNIHYLAPSRKSLPSPALEALSVRRMGTPGELLHPGKLVPHPWPWVPLLWSPQPWGIQMLVSGLCSNCSYLMAWNTSLFPVVRYPTKTQGYEVIRSVAESVSFPSSFTFKTDRAPGSPSSVHLTSNAGKSPRGWC